MEDYDPDGNDILDLGEVERLRALAFEGVKDFSYFLYVGYGSDSVASPTAEGFHAVLSEEHISYSFSLPYRLQYLLSPLSRIKHLTFTLKDPTGYFEVNLSAFRPLFSSCDGSTATFLVT